MARERLAEQIGRVPPRYAGVAAQIALGTSALLTTPATGSIFLFVESQLNISSKAIGILLIVCGIIAGLTENKWVYWSTGVGFFILYSLVAFIGAVSNVIPFQAGIIYLALAAYAFLTFPREGVQHGR
jgi:hypothetical protein